MSAQSLLFKPFVFAESHSSMKRRALFYRQTGALLATLLVLVSQALCLLPPNISGFRAVLSDANSACACASCDHSSGASSSCCCIPQDPEAKAQSSTRGRSELPRFLACQADSIGPGSTCRTWTFTPSLGVPALCQPNPEACLVHIALPPQTVPAPPEPPPPKVFQS